MGYQYKSADVLNNRISYSYSVFNGVSFIDDFKEYRQSIFVGGNYITDETRLQNIAVSFSQQSDFSKMMNSWIKQIHETQTIDKQIYLLLKRFEVTKRIYTAYDDLFRPLDKRSYFEHPLYLKFGYLLVICFIASNKLQFLNGLLKLNDILCCLAHKFNEDEKSLFYFLIKNEIQFLRKLGDELNYKL